MAKMKMANMVGNIAGLVGIFGALRVRLFAALDAPWVSVMLVIAGILIGILNIGRSEKAMMIVIAIFFGMGIGFAQIATLPVVGGIAVSILGKFTLVFVPAGVIVAVLLGIKYIRR